MILKARIKYPDQCLCGNHGSGLKDCGGCFEREIKSAVSVPHPGGRCRSNHQKTGQVQRGKQSFIGLHFLPGNIEDDPVMPLVKAVCRAGHMDQIGIDKNQIPGSCLVLSVIKKKIRSPSTI